VGKHSSLRSIEEAAIIIARKGERKRAVKDNYAKAAREKTGR